MAQLRESLTRLQITLRQLTDTTKRWKHDRFVISTGPAVLEEVWNEICELKRSAEDAQRLLQQGVSVDSQDVLFSRVDSGTVALFDLLEDARSFFSGDSPQELPKVKFDEFKEYLMQIKECRHALESLIGLHQP